MSQYLLDTNIASCIIKGHPAVRRRLVAVPMYEIAISAVTEGELRYGAARLPADARLHTIVEDFLIRVAIHPWDSAAAQEYGRVRAALERRAGDALGNLDTMIAAHALARGAVLVTHDKAFARVKGLKVADWTKP
jgi:tRNA(fMet)-specific endonuclease VapC